MLENVVDTNILKQKHLIHQSSKESTTATAKEGPVRLGYRHES